MHNGFLKKVIEEMEKNDVEVVLPNAIGQDSLVGQTQKVSVKRPKMTQNATWTFHEFMIIQKMVYNSKIREKSYEQFLLSYSNKKVVHRLKSFVTILFKITLFFSAWASTFCSLFHLMPFILKFTMNY